MMPGTTGSTPGSVVVLASTETGQTVSRRRVASILAPFPGETHVLSAGTPEGSLPDAVRAAAPVAVIVGPLHGEAAPWRSSSRLARSLIPKLFLPMILLRREHEHPPRRILVATDFSSHADRAFELATAWAGAWALDAGEGDPGAGPVEVELLHISDFARPGRRTVSGNEALRNRLAAQAPLTPAHVRLSSRMLSAPLAPDGIEAAVNELQPDLLFVGTHGHGPFGRAVFGSVALEVLRRVSCSVVVVPLPR
jgi:nucleotide-binding universal stress UspA family protein